MTELAFMSYQIFSGGQIAGIVLLSVFAAALIAFNVYLICLLKKRGEHRLYSEQLQRQREALMRKLAAMRSGTAVIPDVKFTFMYPVSAGEDEEPDGEEDETDEADADIDEDEEALDVEVTPEGNVVRYNRSFEARIIQAKLDLKARYSELKNYILSFGGVCERLSWKKETFCIGRRGIACFTVRGKTLCLFLSTDPSLFEGTKYKVIDISERSKKNKMPCMFRITSDRSTGYAKELIDIVMAGFGLSKSASYEPQDFTLPYRSTEVLVKRKRIKIVGGGIPDYEREDALAAAKRIRYNRSFEARIIQADNKLKEYYSRLKNYTLAHDGVKANATWKKENFVVQGKAVATFFIRGKTLCVCMALDPKPFEGTKYKVQDLSTQVGKNKLPLLFKVKNARRVTYAIDLLGRLFTERGIVATDVPYTNYAVPFVATDTLVKRGLIKIISNNDDGDGAVAEKRTPPVRKRKSKKADAAEETAVEKEVAVTGEPDKQKS